MESAVTLRAATPADVPTILTLIRGLAEYEHLLDMVEATEARLQAQLFGERPAAEVVLAEWEGQPIGFALFFTTFSTFLGKPGIYLEDLFVLPEHRGKGAGNKLLRHLAALAVERGCGRLEWTALDWNTPALEFYRARGAAQMKEWILHRVTGDGLNALAEGA